MARGRYSSYDSRDSYRRERRRYDSPRDRRRYDSRDRKRRYDSRDRYLSRDRYDRYDSRDRSDRRGDRQELCRDFMRGRCTYGDSCRYSHRGSRSGVQGDSRERDFDGKCFKCDKSGHRQRDCPMGRGVCYEFVSGDCRFGDTCKFAHREANDTEREDIEKRNLDKPRDEQQQGGDENGNGNEKENENNERKRSVSEGSSAEFRRKQEEGRQRSPSE